MTETFLLRLEGGPFPGDCVAEGYMGYTWPLPDTLPDPEQRGEYRKISESQLPAGLPGVVRGAQYEWVAAESQP